MSEIAMFHDSSTAGGTARSTWQKSGRDHFASAARASSLHVISFIFC